MTTRQESAAQGFIADPVHPKGHKVAAPDGEAILRGIQQAVISTDAAITKPRPPQRLLDPQDYRRG
jgi:hypothetical protein